MQRAEPAEVFFGGQQILDARGMTDPQQIARQFAALFVEWQAIEQDLTGGRLHQPRKQAQKAGLAAAVGTADLQHFATGQSQFEIFEKQPEVSLTGEGNGLQDWTGQEITGLYGSSQRRNGR